jgi:hypothetical protein
LLLLKFFCISRLPTTIAQRASSFEDAVSSTQSGGALKLIPEGVIAGADKLHKAFKIDQNWSLRRRLDTDIEYATSKKHIMGVWNIMSSETLKLSSPKVIKSLAELWRDKSDGDGSSLAHC